MLERGPLRNRLRDAKIQYRQADSRNGPAQFKRWRRPASGARKGRVFVASNSRRLIVNLSASWPLIAFVVPTLAIGFSLVIPRSCVAGVNELTIGFAVTIAG